jgi:hypothetical protein
MSDDSNNVKYIFQGETGGSELCSATLVGDVYCCLELVNSQFIIVFFHIILLHIIIIIIIIITIHNKKYTVRK